VKLIIKSAIGIAVVVILLMLPPLQTWLLVLSLPDFPDWPEPVTALTSEDEGVIFYATVSPFDLEVLLSGYHSVETTDQGWLVRS
jgi:hypothetical protein